MRKHFKRSYRIGKYIVYRHTLLKPLEHLWTFLGAFIGIGAIGLTQSGALGRYDNILLIGSFGASAVLVYGATNSPLAQPRNLVGGHVLSAIVGVIVCKIIPEGHLWLASALAVSLSIILMQITKTMHPPGGATALIAVIGSSQIKAIGFGYVVSPVLSGVLILFVVALLVNNIPKDRKYPCRQE